MKQFFKKLSGNAGPLTLVLILHIFSGGATASAAAANPAPAGNYTFSDQADLDAFTNAQGRYTAVAGDLVIDATGTVTDLSNLALIETVSGTLRITNYGVDETIGDPLAEFTSLTQVSRLVVGAGTGSLNAGLAALTSSSLTQVTNRITVTRSEQLNAIDLPAVVAIGSRIALSRLTSLTTLRIPAANSALFSLSLTDLPALTDLQLDAITGTGDLILQNLTSLEGLDGLSGLASLDSFSTLRIDGNQSLLSVAGLGSSAGGLLLQECSVSLTGNSLLTSVATISGTVGITLTVRNNPQLADLGTGMVLQGYLFHIVVASNPLLTSVAALFSGADTLGVEALDIFDNASLTDLGTRPVRLDSDMYLADNPEITDLPNLTATRFMTGDFQGLYIENNAKLNNLAGLTNLTTIGGDVYIAGNGMLTTLDGMDSLRVVGGALVIEHNSSLYTLDAFRSLDTVSVRLAVNDNALLSECCVLKCSVVVNEAPVSASNTSVTISGNQGDCADATTLDASSCPSSCFSASPALPVTLTEFSGKSVGVGNLLRWVTAAERDNAYFVIEVSKSGQHFTEIGRVAAAANGSSSPYRFRHPDASSAKTYYRLVTVDLDGSRHNVGVITIGVSSRDEAWSIFPNPAGSRAVPEILIPQSGGNGKVTIVVIDAVGRQVASRTTREAPAVPVAAHSLPDGVYAVCVITATERRVLQLVIR